MDERLLAIAQAIHSEVCGCDDKSCTTTDEIYDWLYNGDNPDSYTLADVPDMIAEWKEYEGQND